MKRFEILSSLVVGRALMTLVASLGFLSVAIAQSPAGTGTASRGSELKIGFVNTAKLLRESTLAQRATKKLEREFATRQAEVEKLAKRFRDASSAFDKDSLGMSDDARRTRQRELETMSRDLQRAQRELREDENLRMNEEVAALQERAQRVIQRIAETEKFDLILQDAVYVHPRIDITERVLKALAE